MRREWHGQADIAKGKFVLNRKSFLLCFQQTPQRNGDFEGFICIEQKFVISKWRSVIREARLVCSDP